MIYRVTGNQSTFHDVEFTRGLNLVVGERSANSDLKDTRNGVGKTTLIEIMDFCLGSDGRGLLVNELADWAFTIELDVGLNRVRVTREIVNSSRVIIEGPTLGWMEQPEQDNLTGLKTMSVARWKDVLGWELFKLPIERIRHSPTYRSLMSYFIRHGTGAYLEPFKFFPNMPAKQKQANIAYLLGLNWEYAARLALLDEQREEYNRQALAIEEEAAATHPGSIGGLETARLLLDERISREREQLASFRVHPQYIEILEETNQLTAKIQKLLDEIQIDKRIMDQYLRSITAEIPPDQIDVENLYHEVGLVFQPAAHRTLQEARAFHVRIVKNRREFLQAEMENIKRRIAEREAQVGELSDVRANALHTLHSHGALEELVRLQERHVDAQSKLARVEDLLTRAKDVSERLSKLRIAREELLRNMKFDHEQRRETWSAAVRLFNDNSQALYSSPGFLIIDVDHQGYMFDVEIPRKESSGISKMEVFCFDLMLLQLKYQRRIGLDFLVHDSTVFEGVDSRQVAHALEHARDVTEADHTQYIVTMNTDSIPYADFRKGFRIGDYVRLTLTDKDPSDSLLGFDFSRTQRLTRGRKKHRPTLFPDIGPS